MAPTMTSTRPTPPGVAGREKRRVELERERKRRHKNRNRRGALVVPVEVEPFDGEALRDKGLLSVNQVEDRDAIGRAILRLLRS